MKDFILRAWKGENARRNLSCAVMHVNIPIPISVLILSCDNPLCSDRSTMDDNLPVSRFFVPNDDQLEDKWGGEGSAFYGSPNNYVREDIMVSLNTMDEETL